MSMSMMLTASLSGVVASSGPKVTRQSRTLEARSSRVAVVGDSLTWQAGASIEALAASTHQLVTVSANPGHALSTPWARATLTEDLREGSVRVIVVATASNDAALAARNVVTAEQYAEILNRLVDSAAGRCLVIMNAKEDVYSIYYQPSDARAINSVIRATAASHANVRVIDWNLIAEGHGSWFSADLLHLSPGLPSEVTEASPPGAALQSIADRGFARSVMSGVNSCGTTR